MKLDLKSKIDILPDKALKEIRKLYNKHASDCATLTKRILKENINKGLGADDEPLDKLEDSTIAVRKVRGISGRKPLKATGKLYKGIKTKKNLVLNTVEYGEYHNDGFIPKKIPKFYKGKSGKVKVAVGKKGIYFKDNDKQIDVPKRRYFDIPKRLFKSERYKELQKKMFRDAAKKANDMKKQI